MAENGPDYDALCRNIVEVIELAKLRKEHTYVEGLIKLLLPHKNGMTRRWILDTLEKQRKDTGLPIPGKFEEAVQSSYNQNCVDSTVFRQRGLPDSEAPFYSPGGKGSGMWAVNSERARSWLEKRRRTLL